MLERWEIRRSEFEKLHAQVDGASLVEQFLRDLTALSSNETRVSLSVASERTGYSADHLSRLIKSGKLTDYGRKHAPRVKVSECPQKSSIAIRTGLPYNADTDALSLVGSRRTRRIKHAS
ncbi:MAG: hypothetical protein WD802_03845 [Gemmatimonadaceae bacterium]